MLAAWTGAGGTGPSGGRTNAGGASSADTSAVSERSRPRGSETTATSTNAQLLAMSGNRNPYPGKLGVVEEGALADLLLVDGNPLENLQLIEDPAKNLVVIIKNGAIAKNLITPASKTSP